jgi:hypothetical protein
MISRTRIIGGGIILLVCLACVLPALALELNPLSYILRQPTPAPAITRIDVREAVTTVPVQTGTPVPYLTISPVKDGIAPATTQTGGGVTLEGTITEVAYSGEYDLGFAFLELSDGSGVVLLVSDAPAGDLMYDLFQTAYLKGNLVKAYTGNPVKEMEILGFKGPGKYRVYSIDSFDLGPVHPV